MFLVDTGSALTILRKDTWERCKEPQQQLVPWRRSRLVGAEGSQLHVFRSATVTLSIEGEKYELSVVVIDPLTSEAILGLDVLTHCTVDLSQKQLITGAGHAVTMCCQHQNMGGNTNIVDSCEGDAVNTGTSEDQSSLVDVSFPLEKSEKIDILDVNLSQEGSDNNFRREETFQTECSHSVLQHNTPGVFPARDPSAESGHVLSVKVIDNVRIPSFSELEILAQVRGDGGNNCYMLESNLQNSDLLVARAVVTPGDVVPVRLLNPTGKSITLYSGASVAVLSEVVDIGDNPSEEHNVMENMVKVSAVGGDKERPLIEEMLMELVKETSLSGQHQDLLLTLLLDYSDIFARSKDELGRTDLLQHEIITDGTAPIRQRFRRLSPEKRAEMRAMLNDMLKENLISPSKSPWAAPIVLVNKKDGISQFCVDYRRINAVTRKDAYPLPRVDDILETLAGSQLFSTLDLASGYWQVEVKPEDREKTAFITSEGLYEFNVLPFGLCNGLATFQHLMNILLAAIQWHDCLVYLDDIIVLGRSFDEHLKNLAKIFQRLREANLKLQVKKCVFGRETVKFLGHIISSAGIATDPERLLELLSGQFR